MKHYTKMVKAELKSTCDELGVAYESDTNNSTLQASIEGELEKRDLTWDAYVEQLNPSDDKGSDDKSPEEKVNEELDAMGAKDLQKVMIATGMKEKDAKGMSTLDIIAEITDNPKIYTTEKLQEAVDSLKPGAVPEKEKQLGAKDYDARYQRLYDMAEKAGLELSKADKHEDMDKRTSLPKLAQKVVKAQNKAKGLSAMGKAPRKKDVSAKAKHWVAGDRFQDKDIDKLRGNIESLAEEADELFERKGIRRISRVATLLRGIARQQLK